MEKLGIYCRVSSKSQEDDGTSIDYQIKIGKKVSKKLGMDFELYNEGGKSSWTSNINTRPELVRLINDIEKKKISSVWGWNIDRIGRNSESWYTIFKILIGWKVDLYLGENLKPHSFNSPTERLTIGILSLITTYDNELRRTRMIFGKMESLRKGQTFVGGTIPFGYDVDEHKRLVINESESEMIVKMYEMYRDGKTSTDIQLMLDNSSFQPKRSKGGWNLGTIQKMLGNELYNGQQIWTWKEIEPDGTKVIVETIKVDTPIIVNDDLFFSVKKRRTGFQRHNQYDTDYHSLLKGFLICSHCGLPMNHRMKKKEVNDYYYCVYMERSWLKRDKRNHVKWSRSGDTCDMKKSLIMKQTDDMVWNEFLKIFSNSVWVKQEFKLNKLEPKRKMKSEVESTLKKNRDKISILKNQQKSIQDQLIEVELKNMSGKLKSKEVYEGLVNKLDKSLTEVSNEIQRLLEENVDLDNRDMWVNWVEKMSKEVDKMKEWNEEEKREKLEQFIKKIYVTYNSETKEHNLTFDFSLPLIGDKLVYRDVKDKSKGYDLEKGEHQISIKHKNPTFKPSEKKLELMKIMSSLRQKGMSYLEISDYLNEYGIKTIRGLKWTKHSVGRFLKYVSQNVNLVEISNETITDFRGKKKGK